MECAGQPHDARQVLNGRIGSDLIDQALLQCGELIARNISAKIEMHASSAFYNHAWSCAACLKCLDAAVRLLIAICIDKEGARSHDIFAASTLKIGFVDCHKDADTPLRRIERLHFRPHLVEGSMKNFGVAVQRHR